MVESRSSGRHVIELNEPDIRELYVVRRALERVAVRLAARNACRRNRDALSRCLQELRQAVADQDRSRVIAADVETHWSIWRQAENKHLFHMLNSMIGPIFMFVAHNIDAANWGETLAQHEAMVVAVQAGDEAAAIRGLDRHMDHALEHSIRSFRASQANDRDA